MLSIKTPVLDGASTEELRALANSLRESHWGQRITFSPKVFIPITNLCRNFCSYCSYRKSPGQAGEWTMSPKQILQWLDKAKREGCIEALFCLGDKPETAFKEYRALLGSWGFSSTVEYIHWACIQALERGLLPHTNAGILSSDEMEQLKPVNVSLGLMLENSSPRLRERGQAHHRAPDKDPARRLRMLEDAGELRIPFTTGILVGIGETRAERIQSLKDIATIHQRFGHIQEVIVQNFQPHPNTPMGIAPGPAQNEITDAIALARIILPIDISVQTPPNLNPKTTTQLLDCGINDLGGISPLTPDYINPNHPWPHLKKLAKLCQKHGRSLRPRLPIYQQYITKDGYLEPAIVSSLQKQLERVDTIDMPWALSPTSSTSSSPNQPNQAQ